MFGKPNPYSVQPYFSISWFIHPCMKRALMVLSLGSLAGCGEAWSSRPKWVILETDCARYRDAATVEKDADKRRKAVERLGATSCAKNAATLELLDKVAREDASPMVRAAALRSLAECDDPQVVVTSFAVLAQSAEPAAAAISARAFARPSENPLRRQAADALYTACRKNIPQKFDMGDQAQTLIIEQSRRESARDVRIALVRCLEFFPNPGVVDALMERLDDPDFGVVYAACQSLRSLTGQDLPPKRAAWESWLAQKPELFAHRGEWRPAAPVESRLRRWWWPPDYFTRSGRIEESQPHGEGNGGRPTVWEEESRKSAVDPEP